ncbi:glycosyltransferase, partial [Thioclava sp. BHET1]
DAEGVIEVALPGMRHLILHDEATGQETRVPVYRPWNWASAGLRAALSLASFPLRHGADIYGYFLRGDSTAGDRMERALLPQLAPLDHIPEAAVAFFGTAPLPAIDAPVGIVIRVYNAAEGLQICLERLAAHTPEPHRIWLIDDASPDPALAPILQAFARAHPQAQALKNDRNLGFVGTVNRGLDLARGHVVLLNTDALVPEGWLSRLMAPILAAGDVASVTPLSNDAEIFDAPVDCVARVLEEGEAAQADRAARQLNWQVAQAEAPTGVGFCMALARDWLAKAGTLDPIFGRGYGEEVDWCRRVAALGGRHIGIGTLFVEHRSGSSFGAEKSERVQANNRIVSGRYPTYDLMVQKFRDVDPLVGPRLA